MRKMNRVMDEMDQLLAKTPTPREQ
jgi:hypothetical protein